MLWRRGTGGSGDRSGREHHNGAIDDADARAQTRNTMPAGFDATFAGGKNQFVVEIA